MDCWRVKRALEARGYEERRLRLPGQDTAAARPRRWVHHSWKKERRAARGEVVSLSRRKAKY